MRKESEHKERDHEEREQEKRESTGRERESTRRDSVHEEGERERDVPSQFLFFSVMFGLVNSEGRCQLYTVTSGKNCNQSCPFIISLHGALASHKWIKSKESTFFKDFKKKEQNSNNKNSPCIVMQ